MQDPAGGGRRRPREGPGSAAAGLPAGAPAGRDKTAAAGKEAEGLLIFYFFVDEKDNYVTAIRMLSQSGSEFVSVKIPAEEILKDAFQKIDVTWDEKKLTVYHNGDYQDEAALPGLFAEEAVKPRNWGSLQILPFFLSDGDDLQTRSIIDEVKIYDSPLSAEAVQKAYAQENGK